MWKVFNFMNFLTLFAIFQILKLSSGANLYVVDVESIYSCLLLVKYKGFVLWKMSSAIKDEKDVLVEFHLCLLTVYSGRSCVHFCLSLVGAHNTVKTTSGLKTFSGPNRQWQISNLFVSTFLFPGNWNICIIFMCILSCDLLNMFFDVLFSFTYLCDVTW